MKRRTDTEKISQFPGRIGTGSSYLKCYRVYQGSRRSVAVSVTLKKTSKKKLSEKNLSTKLTLRIDDCQMKLQCKFETSTNEQSGKRSVFSSFNQVAVTRAAMATTTPEKNTGKGCFFIAPQSRGLDHVAKGTELPDRRKKKMRNSSRCGLTE